MWNWLKNVGGALAGKAVHIGALAVHSPELVKSVANVIGIKPQALPQAAQDLIGIGTSVLKEHGWDGDPATLHQALYDFKNK